MNKLQVTFENGSSAVYHIARGNKIKEVLAELEAETGEKIIHFQWL
jgi:hypothetical protein